jgi:hypothetical protein
MRELKQTYYEEKEKNEQSSKAQLDKLKKEVTALQQELLD